MNDTFGIEITYFGRPFRAGPGWPHPGLFCSSPSGGKTGGLFFEGPRAAAGDSIHGVSKFPTRIKVSDRPYATLVGANQRQSPQTHRECPNGTLYAMTTGHFLQLFSMGLS
jgi:hypothetical protein